MSLHIDWDSDSCNPILIKAVLPSFKLVFHKLPHMPLRLPAILHEAQQIIHHVDIRTEASPHSCLSNGLTPPKAGFKLISLAYQDL